MADGLSIGACAGCNTVHAAIAASSRRGLWGFKTLLHLAACASTGAHLWLEAGALQGLHLAPLVHC